MSAQKQTVQLVINYAGLSLLVSKDSKGNDITALKPISDMFGLIWHKQKAKVLRDAELFGIVLVDRKTGNEISGTPRCIESADSDTPRCIDTPDFEQKTASDAPADFEVMIRVDSVIYYMMNISVARIKSQDGNEDGKALLVSKIKEWKAALHDYETYGFAINHSHDQFKSSKNRARREFFSSCKTLNEISDAPLRKAAYQILSEMADELGAGAHFQKDLLDAA